MMIEKTNFLNEQVGRDNSFDVQILPIYPGLKLVHEYELEIAPEQEQEFKVVNARQEVLYCITGRGTLVFSSSEEDITRGDRVLISEEKQFIIQNKGSSPLLVSLKGINFNDAQ